MSANGILVAGLEQFPGLLEQVVSTVTGQRTTNVLLEGDDEVPEGVVPVILALGELKSGQGFACQRVSPPLRAGLMRAFGVALHYHIMERSAVVAQHLTAYACSAGLRSRLGAYPMDLEILQFQKLVQRSS